MFRELWYDEVFSYLAVSGSWGNLSRFVSEDIHPPLYYILLKLWTGVFGYGEFALRSLSLMFFLATLYISFIWIKKVTGSKLGGFLGSVFIGMSPFMWSYAFEARAYSMFAFLVVFACFCLYKALKESPHSISLSWMLFGITLSAMFLTHYISFFIFPAFGIVILGFHLLNDQVIKSLKVYVAIAIPFLIIFSIYSPALRYHFSKETNTKWIPEYEVSTAVTSVYAFFFGVDSKSVGVPQVSVVTKSIDMDITLLIVFVSVLALIIHNYRDMDNLFFWMVSILVAVPVLITAYMSLQGINFYIDRYLIGMGTLLLILFGTSLVYNKYGLFVVFWYVIALSSISYPNGCEGYRELATKVAGYSNVVFDSPLEYSTAKYYLKRDNVFVYDFFYQQDYRNWISIDYGESLKELPEDGVLVTQKNRNGHLLDTACDFKVYSLEGLK